MMSLSVLGTRVRLTLLAVPALLATVLLLVSLPAVARAAGPLCLSKRMNIVAHQDDDLIFLSPDLLETIAAGDCVRTVFVTAGDAGLGEAYWREREEGSRSAYAMMAGVANSWTKSESNVAGHTLHLATLTGKPAVSQVYMRLPNGGPNGTGYAATGFKSLPKLWRSHNPEPAGLAPISEIAALDRSATYSYEGLLATLGALIAEYEPEVVSTQDFTREFGTGDHADHIAVAKLTHIAANSWTAEHVLRSFMDYETKNLPVNVFEPQLAKKLSAYYAYAAHDSNEACASQVKCEEPFFADYWAWLKRQVIASETAVPGADAGVDQSVGSKTTVTLNGSNSSDPLGHTLGYEWKQTGGTTVSLSNSHAVKPTFTAPTGPTTLTFSLVVKSSEASSAADAVTVTVAAPRYALSISTAGNGVGTVTSSPAGISCPTDCEESYESATKIALTPSPAAGSEFKGWSGACSGTGACEVTMSAAKSVGVEFALQRHALSVSKSGTGSGTVTSSPAGISCGATCSAGFDHGTPVKLSGSPATGSKAMAWTGCDHVNGSNECEVTMSTARSVTATFAAIPQLLLTVGKSGSGIGTVTSTPAGIECGSECSHSYFEGTLVTLTGAPGANTKAIVWQNCPGTVNASNQCEVTMGAAKSVAVSFSLEQHPLSVSKSGTGSGTVTSTSAGIGCGSTCSASYDYGTLVKLAGTPAAGSKSVVWSGCDKVNGSNQCEVAMSAAKSVSATFNLESHQLTVVKNGSGTVTSSPAGISCGATCSAGFDHGTPVKLSGSPATGSKAVAWTGCDHVDGSNECEVTMGAIKAVTATFDLEIHQLAVSKSGTGTGTVTSSPAGISCGATCAAGFDHSTLVRLTGTPGPNSKSVIWGSCPGTVNASNQCEVTIDAAKEAAATFNLESHQLTVVKNGSGTVTSSPAGISCGATCSAGFDHGTPVKLSGSPATGSKAVAWTGCDHVDGSNECEVTMGEATSVSANFALLGTYPLTVTRSGSGSGTVTSSPVAIDCGSRCSGDYTEGSPVTLTGIPASGTEPVAWELCPGRVNASNQCEVNVDAAKEAKARFDLESHLLIVGKTGSGTSAVIVTSSPAGIECGSSCATSFEHGTKVTLSAPTAGAETVVWSGCDEIAGDNSCRVWMNADKEVSAKLEPVLSQTPTPIPSPPPGASAPPSTKLLKAKIVRGVAKFVFDAEGDADLYRCALAKPGEKLLYRRCISPITYRSLSPGSYVFKVEAIGPGGIDASPITRRFKVPAVFGRRRSACDPSYLTCI